MEQKVVKKEKADEINWREKFATKVVASNPGLEQITKGDKLLLKFKNNLIARLMLRKSVRFTCYRKINSDRATMRIATDKEEQELADWISQRVSELKINESKPKKEKKSKKAKKDA